MNVTVKEASMDEFEEINQKMKQAFIDISVKYVGDPNLIPPEISDGSLLKEFIPKKEYFNIFLDIDIVGGYYIRPYKNSPKDMELRVFWVATEHQGKGIGTIGWNLIEQTHKSKVWWLETPKFALSNQHFYEKLGFKKVKENAFPTVTLILYRKEIINNP
jgi:GNAT superfamily N-acetyltransferase